MKKTVNPMIAILILLLVLLHPMVSSASTVTAEISDDIIITINGERVPFKAAIAGGRSYLPIRVLGYALNATVEWVEPTREILLQTQDDRLPHQEFSDLVRVGGRKVGYLVDNMHLSLNNIPHHDISKSILAVENRSYLPLRVIAEKLGIRATWDSETKTIDIVNPRTITISEIDQPYYVVDLPIISTQEDYFVGNWIGNGDFTDFTKNIIFQTDLVLYISKNSNDTYKIVARNTFNDPVNQENNGDSFIAQFTDAQYDVEHSSLNVDKNQLEVLKNTTKYISIWGRSDAIYYLDGDVLYVTYPELDDLTFRFKRF